MIKVKGLLKVSSFEEDGCEVMSKKGARWLKLGLVLCKGPDTRVDFEAVFGFEVILGAEKHSVVCNNNLNLGKVYNT